MGKGKGKEVPMDVEDVLEPLPAGRGKAKESQSSAGFPAAVFQVPTDNLSICGICFEATRITHDPYRSSISAASSSTIQYGMYIGAEEDQHVYCISCLSTFIMGKLEDPLQLAFPITCPDVSLDWRFRLRTRLTSCVE